MIAESFAIPGVGAIIEETMDGEKHILIQERLKGDAPETGLLEIPAGKVRQFESVYECLRREVWEETGLVMARIIGEEESEVVEGQGYRVLNYTPFSSAQNLAGSYPIMVQVFICQVTGTLPLASSEATGFQWISVGDLHRKLADSPEEFYPMHVATLRKYCRTSYHT